MRVNPTKTGGVTIQGDTPHAKFRIEFNRSGEVVGVPQCIVREPIVTPDERDKEREAVKAGPCCG